MRLYMALAKQAFISDNVCVGMTTKSVIVNSVTTHTLGHACKDRSAHERAHHRELDCKLRNVLATYIDSPMRNALVTTATDMIASMA